MKFFLQICIVTFHIKHVSKTNFSKLIHVDKFWPITRTVLQLQIQEWHLVFIQVQFIILHLYKYSTKKSTGIILQSTISVNVQYR